MAVMSIFLLLLLLLLLLTTSILTVQVSAAAMDTNSTTTIISNTTTTTTTNDTTLLASGNETETSNQTSPSKPHQNAGPPILNKQLAPGNFLIKGIVYAPTPIGYNPDEIPLYSDAFFMMHEQDLQTISSMGANTIQLWGWNNHGAEARLFFELVHRHKLNTISTFRVDFRLYPDIITDFERQKVIRDFTEMLENLKDETSIMMWMIGDAPNVEYDRVQLDYFFTLVDEFAKIRDRIDSKHRRPLAIPLADSEDLIQLMSVYNNYKGVEIWAPQLRRGCNISGFFEEFKNISSKPLLVMDFGDDAWNAIDTMREDQTKQALCFRSQWDQVAEAHSANVAIGGVAMEFVDQWWRGDVIDKALPTRCPDTDPSRQTPCGEFVPQLVDFHLSLEFLGVFSQVTNWFQICRRPRLASRALTQRWTGNANPQLDQYCVVKPFIFLFFPVEHIWVIRGLIFASSVLTISIAVLSLTRNTLKKIKWLTKLFFQFVRSCCALCFGKDSNSNGSDSSSAIDEKMAAALGGPAAALAEMNIEQLIGFSLSPSPANLDETSQQRQLSMAQLHLRLQCSNLENLLESEMHALVQQQRTPTLEEAVETLHVRYLRHYRRWCRAVHQRPRCTKESAREPTLKAAELLLHLTIFSLCEHIRFCENRVAWLFHSSISLKADSLSQRYVIPLDDLHRGIPNFRSGKLNFDDIDDSSVSHFVNSETLSNHQILAKTFDEPKTLMVFPLLLLNYLYLFHFKSILIIFLAWFNSRISLLDFFTIAAYTDIGFVVVGELGDIYFQLRGRFLSTLYILTRMSPIKGIAALIRILFSHLRIRWIYYFSPLLFAGLISAQRFAPIPDPLGLQWFPYYAAVRVAGIVLFNLSLWWMFPALRGSNKPQKRGRLNVWRIFASALFWILVFGIVFWFNNLTFNSVIDISLGNLCAPTCQPISLGFNNFLTESLKFFECLYIFPTCGIPVIFLWVVILVVFLVDTQLFFYLVGILYGHVIGVDSGVSTLKATEKKNLNRAELLEMIHYALLPSDGIRTADTPKGETKQNTKEEDLGVELPTFVVGSPSVLRRRTAVEMVWNRVIDEMRAEDVISNAQAEQLKMKDGDEANSQHLKFQVSHEAERRLSSFIDFLHRIKDKGRGRPHSIVAMESVSVLVPVYSETILLTRADLQQQLRFIHKHYVLEWQYFTERLLSDPHHRAILHRLSVVDDKKGFVNEPISEVASRLLTEYLNRSRHFQGDIENQIILWASYRTQTVARTIRGAAHKLKATQFLAEIENMGRSPPPIPDPHAFACQKVQIVLSLQTYSLNSFNQREGLALLYNEFPFTEIVFNYDRNEMTEDKATHRMVKAVNPEVERRVRQWVCDHVSGMSLPDVKAKVRYASCLGQLEISEFDPIQDIIDSFERSDPMGIAQQDEGNLSLCNFVRREVLAASSPNVPDGRKLQFSAHREETMRLDENGLFDALSFALYGSARKAPKVRTSLCDFMAQNRTTFAPLIRRAQQRAASTSSVNSEDSDEAAIGKGRKFLSDDAVLCKYIKRMRDLQTPGDLIMLYAFSMKYERKVSLFVGGRICIIGNAFNFQRRVNLVLNLPSDDNRPPYFDYLIPSKAALAAVTSAKQDPSGEKSGQGKTDNDEKQQAQPDTSEEHTDSSPSGSSSHVSISPPPTSQSTISLESQDIIDGARPAGRYDDIDMLSEFSDISEDSCADNTEDSVDVRTWSQMIVDVLDIISMRFLLCVGFRRKTDDGAQREKDDKIAAAGSLLEDIEMECDPIRSLSIKYVLPREHELLLRVNDPSGLIPKAMQGKAVNQSHALPFCRGQVIQAFDSNQDGYFEEALKLRHLLDKFFGRGSRRRAQYRIVGFREHVFSDSFGSVARFMAFAEHCFVTICQRVLSNPLGVRLHYGHPDFFDGCAIRTNGGMSKPNPLINLNEDVFAGYKTLLCGERTTHKEYIQDGKGREQEFLCATGFEAKLAEGAAMQLRTRDIFELNRRLNIMAKMSLIFGSLGFYLVTTFLTISIYFFMSSVLSLSLSKITTYQLRTLGSLLAIVWFIQLGFVQTVPLMIELFIERGRWKGIVDTVRDVFGCTMFFLFHIRTKTYYFLNSCIKGYSSYRATGRILPIKRRTFIELFQSYAHSHYVGGATLFGLVTLFMVTSEMSTWENMLRVWSVIIICFSWVFSPIYFNSCLTREGLRQDFDDFIRWINTGEEKDNHKLRRQHRRRLKQLQREIRRRTKSSDLKQREKKLLPPPPPEEDSFSLWWKTEQLRQIESVSKTFRLVRAALVLVIIFIVSVALWNKIAQCFWQLTIIWTIRTINFLIIHMLVTTYSLRSIAKTLTSILIFFAAAYSIFSVGIINASISICMFVFVVFQLWDLIIVILDTFASIRAELQLRKPGTTLARTAQAHDRLKKQFLIKAMGSPYFHLVFQSIQLLIWKLFAMALVTLQYGFSLLVMRAQQV